MQRDAVLAALRDPVLLTQSPHRALGVQMDRLLDLAPIRTVTLWVARAGGVDRAVHRGEQGAGEAARAAAERVLSEDGAGAAAGELAAVPVLRWGRPQAALVAEPHAGEDCHWHLEAAAGLIGAILDRELLLARNGRAEEILVQAAERRLTRLGFDLHDGPLQDLAALAQDLRMLRDHVADIPGEQLSGDVLAGHLDDLEARLHAADAELRRITGGLGSPVMLTRPFEELLEQAAGAFRARCSIRLDLRVEGDWSEVSNSQRIALMRIVQEALSNVREHSEATRVGVTVRSTPTHTEAFVVDDGVGFDPAEPCDRRGVLGMHERARLLGGACRVASAPGGPTEVAVHLPAWRPVALPDPVAA